MCILGFSTDKKILQNSKDRFIRGWYQIQIKPNQTKHCEIMLPHEIMGKNLHINSAPFQIHNWGHTTFGISDSKRFKNSDGGIILIAGFSFSWILKTWSFILGFDANLLSQWGQAWGFIFSWTAAICFITCCLVVNFLSQIVHWSSNFLS